MLNCNQCAAALTANARFCVDCGASVAAATPASAIPTLPPSDIPTPEPGPAHLPKDQLKPGDVIAGKYRIEGLIGQGGMGTVYKATEIASGIMAAVKVIRSQYVGSKSAVDRLIVEGVTTRNISHPNVVRIYDIGLYGEQPYIAMEYIEGVPLHVWRGRKMAQNEAVPVRVTGQIIKEVLNGLEVSHAAGVIHRDMKPENIMLIGEPTSTSATIKIVDFGIALATTTEQQSGSGTGLGTQLYMAPEQIRNANIANAAADLYSVSKIFYELIVGVLPTGHWQPPSGGRADVPIGIDSLIQRGLSDNRDLRPQSANAYRDEMISAFNGQTRRLSQPVTGGTKQEELKRAQADMKDAYKRSFKNLPAWVWIVIVVVILIVIADEMGALASPAEYGPADCEHSEEWAPC